LQEDLIRFLSSCSLMKSKTLTEVFENRVLRKIFEPKVIHELERIA